MSTWISYQNKSLGRIRFDDTNTGKLVFVAENLEALTTLFRLKPTDEIEIEGMGKIPYESFRTDYLQKISGFYSTLEKWLLKNRCERTLAENKQKQKT